MKKFDNRHYILRAGDLLSQALNTIVFNGQTDESTSGRSYRQGELGGKRNWQLMQNFVDWLLGYFEDEHCKKAYLADLERAEERLRQAKLLKK